MKRRLFTFFLAIAMVISTITPLYTIEANEDFALNEAQVSAYEEIQSLGEISGLYGFAEAEISLETDELVPIIVMFKHNPAPVEAALQQASGASISTMGTFSMAMSQDTLAANDKLIFQDALQSIFAEPQGEMGGMGIASVQSSDPYYITLDYDSVINGYAMHVPANKVEELLAVESVAAIFFDETVYVEGWLDEDLEGEAGFAGASNKISSTAMEVQLAHARGEYGAGVKVAVVDTGVDYNHPDLKGAFQSWSTKDEVPEIYKERVHWRAEDSQWVYYGVNAYDMQFYPFTQAPHPYPGIARVDYSGIPGKAADPTMALWDPMEITHLDWKNGYTGTSSFMNNHGTHVSGIIAAQGVFSPNVLGVAPEADLVVYRIGGPGGTGNSSATLKSLEMGIEEGVKIFNYSFGSAGYPGTYGPLGIAVNYATLTYDIIWCKSAGNSGSGPRLITGPGGASMSFVSGNGSYGGTNGALNVEYNVDGEVFTSKLTHTDRVTEFIPHLDDVNDVVAWTFKGPNSEANDDLSHDFFIMPKRVDGNGFEGVGAGEEADWIDKVIDLAKGKIVVIARTSTAAIAGFITRAFNNGAAGLVVIQPASGTQLATSWNVNNSQMNATYIPTTVMAHTVGLNFLYALRTNKDMGHIGSINGNGTFGMSSSSSRGPVADSYEIKPEVVSPGTSIWATVPWYNGASASATTPDISDPTYVQRGYASMSGTSMASPFTAGLCALIWGHDLKVNGEFTMKATEVRARLANTANKDVFISKNWGVNEVGGGGAHIGTALDATSYVTVTKTDIPILRDGKFQSPFFDFGSGEVTSFSFLGSYVGAPTETRMLEANVYNTSSEAKTFEVSYVFQTVGTSSHNIKSNGKLYPVLSVGEVAVAPGTIANPGKANFSASLTIPSGLEETDIGSHEGYIILTNAANAKEVYTLPWSIYIEKGLPEWYINGSETGEFIVSTFDEWRQLIDIVRGGGGGAAGSAGGLGFRDQFAGKTVKLGANITIDLSNTRFSVGTFEWPFKGTFDGNGHAFTFIISSTANPPADLSTNYRALFGHVENAVIKNVVVQAGAGTFANGTIRVSNRSGAIVGMATATDGNQTLIENCINNAIVESGSLHVGGIVGFANVADGGKLTIKDCVNNGAISGTTQVGGILGGTLADVAYIENVISGEIDIINCVNTGTITNVLDYGTVGGIAGTLTGTQVKVIDSTNEGTINAPASVGSYATLTDIYNAVGGVVGYALNATVESSVNIGEINNNKLLYAVDYAAQLRTGGVVGYALNSSVVNSENHGAVQASTGGTAEVVAAGIVGVAENSTVFGSFSTANINATTLAKAIVAVINGSVLDDNYRLGSVLLNGAVSQVNDPTADDGALLDALIVSFPGVLGVNIEYYDNAWHTLDTNVDNGSYYKMPNGTYTVRAYVGGMSYTFSNVVVAGESVKLEVPISTITVTGINVPNATLSLVQSNWVYQNITTTDDQYVFPVFNNGRTYEIRIVEPGLPTRSIGTANSATADGVWAGDTVPFRAVNHFKQVTVNFPGMSGVKVEYYGTSWVTVEQNASDSYSFEIGSGRYTVRVSKDGMSYTFSNVQVGDTGISLDVPVLPIQIEGIPEATQLALVQSNWVYSFANIDPGSHTYLVFDNGRTYELRIREQGQTRSIGTANSTTAEDIWAGATVYVTIPVEEPDPGLSLYEQYQYAVMLWNNVYAWATNGTAPFTAEIPNIYTAESIQQANNLLNIIGNAAGGPHAQAIRDANGGQAGPPYYLDENHADIVYWAETIIGIMDPVATLLVISQST